MHSRRPKRSPDQTAVGAASSAAVVHAAGRRWRSVLLTLMLVMIATGCFAQEQTLSTRRILPEDIEQDSIKMERFSTNSFVVRFTYTESGVKKMLAFRREHAGHEVLLHVGSFERRYTILEANPSGWTDEGYLKHRGDKFFGVSEDDAKKIVEGLRKQ